MSTPPISVTLARVALAEAEVTARAHRRTELIERLRKVRADLRVESAALETLSKKVMEAQTNLDNVRSRILTIVEAIGMLAAQRPATVDYLPEDPEAVRWLEKHRGLEEERVRLLSLRSALPNIELMRIDGVNLAKRVQELMYAEAAILGELDGSLAQFPVGGSVKSSTRSARNPKNRLTIQKMVLPCHERLLLSSSVWQRNGSSWRTSSFWRSCSKAAKLPHWPGSSRSAAKRFTAIYADIIGK
jgi:hypothetical protein